MAVKTHSENKQDNTGHSNMLEHGCRMIYAGFASLVGLGLEDGRVPTFWSLLCAGLTSENLPKVERICPQYHKD